MSTTTSATSIDSRNKFKELTAKKPSVKYYCVPATLKEIHLSQLLRFLEIYNLISVKEEAYKQIKVDMVKATFPKLYRNSCPVPERFEKWGSLVDHLRLSGSKFVCLKNTNRIILPEEAHRDVISQAHRGIQLFKGSVHFDTHNNYSITRSLLKKKYAVGKYEFGIKKSLIKSLISNCQKCKQVQSAWLLTTGGTLSSSGVHLPKGSTTEKGESSENSFVKSLQSGEPVSEDVAPITQAWNGNVIWYNRQALANEKNLYKKLLGVIQEIGLEMYLAVDGSGNAKELLKIKIICAQQIIHKLQSKYTDMSWYSYCSPDSVGGHLELFKKSYLDIERLDTFLYDVNLLLNTPHKITDNARPVWSKLINCFVEQFTSQVHTPDPPPIDFNAPITLQEYDIEPIKQFILDSRESTDNNVAFS